MIDEREYIHAQIDCEDLEALGTADALFEAVSLKRGFSLLDRINFEFALERRQGWDGGGSGREFSDSAPRDVHLRLFEMSGIPPADPEFMLWARRRMFNSREDR